MPAEPTLGDFFAEPPRMVPADPFIFRARLGLGMAAFPILAHVQRLGSWLRAVAFGALGYGLVFLVWGLSLGIFSRLKVAVGLIVGPHWIALTAALVFAALYLLSSKILGAFRQAAVVEVPNFIRVPLNQLAIDIGEIIVPALLHVMAPARAPREMQQVLVHEYLVQRWGYHPDYVRGLIPSYSQQSNISLSDLAHRLRSMAVDGQLGYASVAQELLGQAGKLVAQGKACDEGLQELRLAFAI